MAERQIRVLIVDDTPEDRELVRRYLTRDPERRFEVEEAELGEEGLDAWRKLRPDCSLLDFHLPDMNGLDFLSALMQETGSETLPVVVLTGTGNESIAVEAMKSGAQDYLIKGAATADRLRRAVQNATEKVEMLRQLEAQRRELEQKAHELQEANRRKDEFLAMLAHELRNPLAATSNAVALIKRAGSHEERFQRAMEVLERQVRHQGRLLDDLLDVSRITRGKILLRKERVDLSQVVRDVVQDYRRVLEEKGLQLTAEVPETPIPVEGDATRLSQMVGNLLQNACKFTDSGGSVSVRLAADQDRRAEITVQDDGIGIDSEMLPLLFEPFSQADRTLDRTEGGLGLGLALVKGLAELHGGEVAAQSDGHSRGAKFTVRVPVAASEPDRRSTDGSPAGAGLRRILLIEDNRDAADTLCELLQLFGFEVEVAYTGPEGLDAALSFVPDVILCDLGLPGLDGYDVARKLRTFRELEGTRLIAISGYGRDEDRQRSREAGFDLHLTKPVDPSSLETLLREQGSR